MSDTVLRLLLVAVVLGVAAGLAFLTRRKTSYHPPVDIAGIGLPPGLVVFTSTECTRCKEVLALAKTFEIPLREVTYELEPDLQERVGVVGVPLTLAVDSASVLVGQLAGSVTQRSLRRVVRRAGF